MRFRLAPCCLFLVAGLAAGAAVAQPGAQMGGAQEPIELTGDQVDRYLSALDEFVKMGLDAEQELGSDPSELRAQRVGREYSAKARAVMSRHGFDEQTFSRVHWNVISAYAALQMDEHRPEMEAAMKQQKEQMARMKASMPPDQYEAMMRSLSGMDALAGAYGNVPPGNKKLVAARKASLDRIFQEAGRR